MSSTSPNLSSAKIQYFISAIFIVALILVFTAVILKYESNNKTLSAEITTNNASTLLAEHIGGIFDKANTLLQAAEYEYHNNNTQGMLKTRQFNDYLKRAFSWSEEFNNFGFIDAKGIYRYGIGSENAIDLSDRDYFAVLRDRPVGSGSGPMVFSQPLFARLDGQWAIVMARRIERPDGSFGGVVFIRWNIERLSAILKSIDMGKNGTLAMRSTDMALISRVPADNQPDAEPGSQKVSQEFKDLIKGSPVSGFYTAVSPIDQIQRYFSFRMVGKYPFYLIAGQAVNNAAQIWESNDLILLLFSALMIIFVILGARKMNEIAENQTRTALNNFAERVLLASPVAMILLDKKGVVTKINPAAEKLFDYEKQELIGAHIKKLKPKVTPLDSKQRHNDGKQTSVLINEAPYLRKDGSSFIALQAVSPLPETSGETNHYLETVVDISELKRIQEQLREYADIDKLTGLLNRRSGDLVLDQVIRDSAVNQTHFSVIMGDIDLFKRVNDTYGHLAGDRILVSVAQQLKSAVRNCDSCIRWGGEEFLIILPKCPQSVALQLAERMRVEIADLIDSEVGSITMSFGVSEWIKQEKPASLIDRADIALYRAKTSGRNRVELA